MVELVTSVIDKLTTYCMSKLNTSIINSLALPVRKNICFIKNNAIDNENTDEGNMCVFVCFFNKEFGRYVFLPNPLCHGEKRPIIGSLITHDHHGQIPVITAVLS